MQSPPNSEATWITFPPSSNYEQHPCLPFLNFNAPALAVYRGLGFSHWDTDVMFLRPPE